MSDRSRFASVTLTSTNSITPGVRWICGVCDGAEESAPGFDPPDPAVCHSCTRRLPLIKALGGNALDAVLDADPACRTTDAAVFTGPDAFDDEPETARQIRESAAKAVCGSCPARLACLTYALAIRPREGVWAGFTADQITNLAYGMTSFDRVTPKREVA